MGFGAIVAHPYAMMVYSLTSPDKASTGGPSAINAAARAFSPQMLPMTLAFAFFCGVIALLSAILFERNRSMAEMQAKSRQQQAVSSALQQLVAVLSHFIIHSSLSILAEIQRLRKGDGKVCDMEKFITVLEGIEEQAEKNEAVMEFIRNPEFLDSLNENEGSLSRVIEVTKEIERHISKNENK